MNAVEIEEAISALAEKPFDAKEFPYAFREAIGNKATTLKTPGFKVGSAWRFRISEIDRWISEQKQKPEGAGK